MRVTVLLLAAGSGRRFGADIPKQYIPVAGQPLLLHTLDSLASENRIDAVQVVIAEGDDQYASCVHGRDYPFSLLPPVIGGEERAISMLRGLAALSNDVIWVAVQDAARPVPSPLLLKRVLDAAKIHGAAVPGLPVHDTIKQVDADGRVTATLKRQDLRAIQTPQVARKAWFDQAVASCLQDVHTYTDDASMLEACDFPVFVSQGEASNRKITTVEDMEWLRLQIQG